MATRMGMTWRMRWKYISALDGEAEHGVGTASRKMSWAVTRRVTCLLIIIESTADDEGNA